MHSQSLPPAFVFQEEPPLLFQLNTIAASPFPFMVPLRPLALLQPMPLAVGPSILCSLLSGCRGRAESLNPAVCRTGEFLLEAMRKLKRTCLLHLLPPDQVAPEVLRDFRQANPFLR